MIYIRLQKVKMRGGGMLTRMHCARSLVSASHVASTMRALYNIQRIHNCRDASSSSCRHVSSCRGNPRHTTARMLAGCAIEHAPPSLMQLRRFASSSPTHDLTQSNNTLPGSAPVSPGSGRFTRFSHTAAPSSSLSALTEQGKPCATSPSAPRVIPSNLVAHNVCTFLRSLHNDYHRNPTAAQRVQILRSLSQLNLRTVRGLSGREIAQCVELLADLRAFGRSDLVDDAVAWWELHGLSQYSLAELMQLVQLARALVRVTCVQHPPAAVSASLTSLLRGALLHRLSSYLRTSQGGRTWPAEVQCGLLAWMLYARHAEDAIVRNQHVAPHNNPPTDSASCGDNALPTVTALSRGFVCNPARCVLSTKENELLLSLMSQLGRTVTAHCAQMRTAHLVELALALCVCGQLQHSREDTRGSNSPAQTLPCRGPPYGDSDDTDWMNCLSQRVWHALRGCNMTELTTLQVMQLARALCPALLDETADSSSSNGATKERCRDVASATDGRIDGAPHVFCSRNDESAMEGVQEGMSSHAMHRNAIDAVRCAVAWMFVPEALRRARDMDMRQLIHGGLTELTSLYSELRVVCHVHVRWRDASNVNAATPRTASLSDELPRMLSEMESVLLQHTRTVLDSVYECPELAAWVGLHCVLSHTQALRVTRTPHTQTLSTSSALSGTAAAAAAASSAVLRLSSSVSFDAALPAHHCLRVCVDDYLDRAVAACAQKELACWTPAAIRLALTYWTTSAAMTHVHESGGHDLYGADGDDADDVVVVNSDIALDEADSTAATRASELFPRTMHHCTNDTDQRTRGTHTSDATVDHDTHRAKRAAPPVADATAAQPAATAAAANYPAAAQLMTYYTAALQRACAAQHMLEPHEITALLIPYTTYCLSRCPARSVASARPCPLRLFSTDAMPHHRDTVKALIRCYITRWSVSRVLTFLHDAGVGVDELFPSTLRTDVLRDAAEALVPCVSQASAMQLAALMQCFGGAGVRQEAFCAAVVSRFHALCLLHTGEPTVRHMCDVLGGLSAVEYADTRPFLDAAARLCRPAVGEGRVGGSQDAVAAERRERTETRRDTRAGTAMASRDDTDSDGSADAARRTDTTSRCSPGRRDDGAESECAATQDNPTGVAAVSLVPPHCAAATATAQEATELMAAYARALVWHYTLLWTLATRLTALSPHVTLPQWMTAQLALIRMDMHHPDLTDALLRCLRDALTAAPRCHAGVPSPRAARRTGRVGTEWEAVALLTLLARLRGRGYVVKDVVWALMEQLTQDSLCVCGTDRADGCDAHAEADTHPCRQSDETEEDEKEKEVSAASVLTRVDIAAEALLALAQLSVSRSCTLVRCVYAHLRRHGHALGPDEMTAMVQAAAMLRVDDLAEVCARVAAHMRGEDTEAVPRRTPSSSSSSSSLWTTPPPPPLPPPLDGGGGGDDNRLSPRSTSAPTCESRPPPVTPRTTLVAPLCAKPAVWSTRQVATVLAAMASSGVHDEALFVAMMPRVRYIALHGTPDEVGQILYAYATVRVWHHQLFTRLAERALALRDDWVLRPVVLQLVVGLGKVGMRHERLFGACAEYIAAAAGALRMAEVVDVMTAYAAVLARAEERLYAACCERACQLLHADHTHSTSTSAATTTTTEATVPPYATSALPSLGTDASHTRRDEREEMASRLVRALEQLGYTHADLYLALCTRFPHGRAEWAGVAPPSNLDEATEDGTWAEEGATTDMETPVSET